MTSLWPRWILRGMARPNPLLWIWYTLGGRLGSAYREWVLHDTTCRTRWLRQIVRVVVQVVLPAAVVSVALTELGMDLVVLGGVACGALGLWYSLAYIDQTGDWRLVKHGYEPGTLKQELRKRYAREHGDQIARYMQTYLKAA